MTTEAMRSGPAVVIGLAAMLGMSSAVFADARPTACLSYADRATTLAGLLVREDVYGPPGYGEDPQSDSIETIALLKFDEQICIARGDATSDAAEKTVDALQLVLDRADWKLVTASKNRHFEVRGDLFHGINGHHRTAVLMTVESMRVDSENNVDAVNPAELMRIGRVPVRVGEQGSALDACSSLGSITATDRVVLLRERASGSADSLGKLHPGDIVHLCDESNDGRWLGVVVPSTDASFDCDVSSPVATAEPYRGPCQSGWIEASAVTIDAG